MLGNSIPFCDLYPFFGFKKRVSKKEKYAKPHFEERVDQLEQREGSSSFRAANPVDPLLVRHWMGSSTGCMECPKSRIVSPGSLFHFHQCHFPSTPFISKNTLKWGFPQIKHGGFFRSTVLIRRGKDPLLRRGLQEEVILLWVRPSSIFRS